MYEKIVGVACGYTAGWSGTAAHLVPAALTVCLTLLLASFSAELGFLTQQEDGHWQFSNFTNSSSHHRERESLSQRGLEKAQCSPGPLWGRLAVAGRQGCSGALNTGAGAAVAPGGPGALASLSLQGLLVVTGSSVSLTAFTWPCSRATWLKVASVLMELVGIGPGPGLEAPEREPCQLDTCLRGLILELRSGEDPALPEGSSGTPGEYPGPSVFKLTRGLVHASVRGLGTVRGRLFLREV
ncbi:uncharacterized protein LOC108315148 [Cebus imitator]|uniref:uncharacterized protein LOC108315148 n=1 Tax=Cebus imitator TaxID=2715852 RepID=UPI000809C72A|nr:uncharacterized protein LOC108315148 [Cebus imitator]